MADDYHINDRPVYGPPRQAEAVTPSDSSDLPFITTALHIGGAGDVKVLPVDSSTPVILKGLQAGQVKVGRYVRVYSTDTTATDIVAEV